MRFIRVACLFVSAFLAAAALSPAHAGPRQSPPNPAPPSAPIRHVVVGEVIDPLAPTCNIGQFAAPARDENVVYFDGEDVYYTYLKIDSTQCGDCGSNRMAAIKRAHIMMFVPTAPCTMVVRTAVVSSVPTVCHFQDSTQVLCGGFFSTLVSQDGQVYVDFEIQFPDTCKLFTTPPFGTGEGFLEIKFSSINEACRDSLLKPRLAVRALAQNCNSYNPVGNTNVDFTLEYQTGNPIMWAEVETCINTPVNRRRWGQLKSLYRLP